MAPAMAPAVARAAAADAIPRTTSSTAWSRARSGRSASSERRALDRRARSSGSTTQIDVRPERARRCAAPTPSPNASPRRSCSATSCPTRSTPRSTSSTEQAPDASASRLGWDLVRARARPGTSAPPADQRPVEDPDYRFAVVQSELYRRYLRLAVERFDVAPAGPLSAPPRALVPGTRAREHVERVVHTLLDRCARGLGLEAAR